MKFLAVLNRTNPKFTKNQIINLTPHTLPQKHHQTIYLEHGIKHINASYYHALFNNFGPYQNLEKLIPNVIIRALQQKPIQIYGKGNQIRDWIFVEDHVEALNLIIQKVK